MTLSREAIELCATSAISAAITALKKTKKTDGSNPIHKAIAIPANDECDIDSLKYAMRFIVTNIPLQAHITLMSELANNALRTKGIKRVSIMVMTAASMVFIKSAVAFKKLLDHISVKDVAGAADAVYGFIKADNGVHIFKHGVDIV